MAPRTVCSTLCIQAPEVLVRGMRFRAVLSSVLTVLLLSLSSLASACEARCDLARTGVVCHGSAHRGHSHSGPMAKAMPGMSMGSRVDDSVAQPDHLVAIEAASCEHHVCACKARFCFKDASFQMVRVSLSHPIVLLLSAMLWAPDPAEQNFERRTTTPPGFHSRFPSYDPSRLENAPADSITVAMPGCASASSFLNWGENASCFQRRNCASSRTRSFSRHGESSFFSSKHFWLRCWDCLPVAP